MAAMMGVTAVHVAARTVLIGDSISLLSGTEGKSEMPFSNPSSAFALPPLRTRRRSKPGENGIAVLNVAARMEFNIN